MRARTGRLAAALAAAVLATLAATTSAGFATPDEIEAARADAQAVLADIQAIDAQLEVAIDAYNGATVELEQLEDAIATNQRHLEIAKGALKTAQKNLSDRIVALYTGGEQDVLEVILGSASLDDLLDRVDTVRRISNQDVHIIEAVRDARNDVRRRGEELERDRARQAQVVAEKAAQADSIEAQLAERESLYVSIKDQIADLEAEERARQARLAEEARRREAEREALVAAAEEAGVDQAVVQAVATSSPQGIGSAPGSRLGGQAVAIALQYLGVPYVWGGASPSGFDCSGLVMYVYAQLGVSLPHHAASMFNYGVPVSYSELQPGDLVFANGLGHMGMYVGGGNYIHAPYTGAVVSIASMSSRSDWVGFKRVA